MDGNISCRIIHRWSLKLLQTKLSFYKTFFKWQVGDGKKIPLSSDKWYQPRQVPPNFKKVSDLLNLHGAWKKEDIQNIYSSDDTSSILNTITSTCHCADTLIFHPSKDGNYTVKDGYNTIIRQNLDPLLDGNNHLSQFWKHLWKIDMPPKNLCFLWTLCHNALPLGEALIKRGLKVDGTCPFGGHAIENPQHLFVDCPFARACWYGSRLNVRIGHWVNGNWNLWLQNLINAHKKDAIGIDKSNVFLPSHYAGQFTPQGTKSSSTKKGNSPLCDISCWQDLSWPPSVWA